MSTRIAAPKTKTGPTVNRGGSRQDYGTPPEFLAAVRRRFGALDVDLACHAGNRIAGVSTYFTPADDSLSRDWNSLSGNLWLNPPFSNIEPWAAKCAAARWRHGWTLLLVPASVDANWYHDHVHRQAMVLPLRSRITFVGETHGYPKPLLLAAYGYGVAGFEPWAWRKWL